MRRIIWLLIVTTLIWGTAVACSPVGEEETPADSDSALDERDALNAAPADSDSALEVAPQADPDVFPRATLTPVPVPLNEDTSASEGYPAPAVPTPTPLPEGYVLPPTIPPLSPYPAASGTLIWVIKPVGEQCAEAPTTPDLQTAVADLIAVGIPVEASEMTELSVCTSCGCPTSAHFRLQIDSGYLANAAVLGWMAEE